jgi:predicted phage terminase large subunit-like protein
MAAQVGFDRDVTPTFHEVQQAQAAIRERIQATRQICRESLIDFIRAVAPWFIVEEVHLAICAKLEKLARGEVDRLMVFMAPRTGKSQIASIFFPAWFLGRHPDRKVMQVSYSADLAVNFGRQVRDIVASVEYQAIFPEVRLKADSKAAGVWGVNKRGEYRAVGTTGGVAGKGFNLGIIDDPLSEQDAFSKVAKDRVWEWYGPGFYTRRQPEGNGILVMTTRWALDDLAGKLLAKAKDEKDDPYSDKWEVLSIPAVLDKPSARVLNGFAAECAELHANDNGFDGQVITFKAGESFAPRRWPLPELLRSKSQMSSRYWQALYLQDPTADDGNILLKKWWRRWPANKQLPECEMVIACMDTAIEEDESADFSARTTWGIFKHSDTGDPRDERYCCILLEHMNERLGFPDLRREVHAYNLEHKPDRILIEKRASGAPLLKELRRKGLPVSGWLPQGGSRYSKGKIPRAHAASVVLEQGCVWYPDREWCEKVILQCANFPFDEFDDLVDTCTMAWMFLRRTWWLGLGDEAGVDDDAEDEDAANVGRGEQRRLYG